ncbi:MAG: hypothetical protein QF496_02090 [Dehalococcoidia bacterium]|jgi:hypothetical protein|nr:hypothetical protein [Dehalococcoidia bacterium]HJN58520.1 hypothetical protein [Dehalococcoidia bacterium]|tara:strand:+ start:206 stop:631 length:426 start_codon:yes stop_codon:yes gene_type:complete
MPKVKKSKSKIKNQEPKYQINQHLLEERGLSFTYMIASRLNEIGKVTEKEIMALKLSELLNICSNIKKESELFIMPGNTIGEAIFKILLLNKNKPLTLRQLQSNLTDAWVDVLHLKNLSDEILLNWLGSENQYCINEISTN